MRAVIIDKDYGSVSIANQLQVKEQLEAKGFEVAMEHYSGEDEIIAGCKGAAAILATGNPPITERVMAALPGLKVALRFGVGVNSVDLDAATRLGKVVLFMPGFAQKELMEHSLSLIMALVRNTCYYDRNIRGGAWMKGKYFVPRNISDCTVGLFGFGDAARPLSRVFVKGFGAKVITCDPYVSGDVAKEYGVAAVSFDELLRESDILSVHAPLTAETRGVFDYGAFRKMKPTALFVNISRGEIVNEGDLIRALRDKRIQGAGLDVFEKEPIRGDNPLKTMDNVVLTPHSAFYGANSTKNQVRYAVSLMTSVLLDGKVSPRYVANRDICGRDVGIKFDPAVQV